MKYIIHREGFILIAVAIMMSIIALYAIWVILTIMWLSIALTGIVLLLLTWIILFFRVPVFSIRSDPSGILSGADGKVVAIEKVNMEEFPGSKAMQISVFMSVFNTHLNRYPIAGQVIDVVYNKGKFLPAYHPKSSALNEHCNVKMISDNGYTIWIKQIAGILARRIVNYSEPKKPVYAGEPLGFIKFGSRVDLFLPANVSVNVRINDKVRAGRSIIAHLT